jgi:hypothetical protein
MSARIPSRRGERRSRESGFAYLMALGLIMIMLAGSVALLQNMATEGQRQREDEMIWRGDQYKRAIRLYFHKTGHYPQTVDDLKKGLPELHFLRQEYKDPMNKADGSWRYIYINGAGQIIGSVKYANLQQMAMLDLGNGNMPGMPGAPGQPGLGTPAANLANSGSDIVAFSQQTGPQAGAQVPGGTVNGAAPPGGVASAQGGGVLPEQGGLPEGAQPSDPNAPNQQNAPGQQSGQQPGNQSSQGPQVGQAPPASPFGLPSGPTSGFGQSTSGFGQSTSGFGQSGGLGQSSGFGGSSLSGPGLQGSSFSGASGQPTSVLQAMKPTGPVDGPVIGGFLTGVASTVDKKSIKVYKGGKKYKDWEFIWNPLEDQAQAAQQMLNQAGAGGGLPGQVGQAVGSAFGNFGGVFGSPGSNGPGNLGTGPGMSGGAQPTPQPQPQPQSMPPQ